MNVVKQLFAALLFTLWCSVSPAASDVRVVGLFPGIAVVLIDGERHLLKVGRPAVNGVELLDADAQGARLLVDGKARDMKLSRAVNSSYRPAEKKQVRVSFDHGSNSYPVYGAINGRPVQMVIDTGASMIALSSTQATSLGLDYTRLGTLRPITTASDQVMAYELQLTRVSIGGIERRNVRAVVVEGDYPTQVLLGMSFLKHVKIQENAGVMLLEEKF